MCFQFHGRLFFYQEVISISYFSLPYFKTILSHNTKQYGYVSYDFIWPANVKNHKQKVPYSQPLLFIISFMLNGTLILLILALLVLRGGGIRKCKYPFGLVLKLNIKFNFSQLNLSDNVIIQVCKITHYKYIQFKYLNKR